MRTLFSFAILIMTAAPAIAQAVQDDVASIPEPSVLGLIGIGVLAVLIARRGKK